MNMFRCKKNNNSILFFIVLITVVFINTQELFIKSSNIFGLIDEILILSGLCIVIFNNCKSLEIKKLELNIYLLLALSLLITIISLNLHSHSKIKYGIIFSQTFISFKFFFIYIIFSHVNERIENTYWTRIFKYVVVLSLIGFVTNIIFPTSFDFNSAAYFSERGDRIIGFQLKPNDLAILLGCACFYLSVKTNAPFSMKKSSLIHLILFISILATTSRSGILIALVGMIYGLYKNKSLGLNFIFSILISSVLVFLILTSNSFLVSETIRNISELNNIEDSRYIRFIMLYNSFSVATTYFPLGSGAGTFGTVLSENSWVYRELGLQHLEFFKDFWGIYDSNIASIIGEYGFIFFIIEMFFIYKIILSVIHDRKLTMYLFSIIFIVSTIQPLFAYQVNSINFLLLIFALSEFIKRKEVGIS